MAEVNLLTQLYNDFMIVLKQTVIKYNIMAERNETLDTKRAADAYINAYLMKDKFSTYVKYDPDVIADVMNLDRDYQFDIIDQYHNDNSLFPFNMREKMLLAQRKKILDTYEEKNNYFRMLNGQPDYGDTDFIYVDEETGTKYNINTEIPIHLQDEVKISLLETVGYMDKLREKYPKKKYLSFLGNKKIDIVTARTAKNFAVLRIPYDVSDTLWDRFALIYEQCREYFMTCIYITEMRDTMEYYDNFIAMCIMVMTIQQVIARVIKDTIERNFFDDYCVRTLFSVYGVPYYTYMDSGIKRQIVQDLNILVMNKGTNKVLYDIASILGYDRLKIYKYYLMKVQKFDVNGAPSVYYKEELDPITGEPVLDYERMFDVYFQMVELKDLDTYKSLLDPSNMRSYNEITSGDPFWYEDDDLFDQVYKAHYNFVETKYLGVSIAYRLSRILFENVYLMKMIFEKKDELPGIILDLPKISPFAEVTLFDAICALCAMTCKQSGLKGEILMRPSAIMHVIGFNFVEDFEKIKQDILENPYLDDTLTRFFNTSTTYTVEEINKLYDNIVDLYDEIVEKMSTTQDIEVYDAYRKFYESLYYTDENRKMFGIGLDEEGNEKYANTFLEYLEFANPDLAELIHNTDGDKFTEYINHICQKVIAIIPQLKYFGIMAGRSETMEKMLVDLICFFKSYTTDMLGLNVLYIFDMKPELLLRLIDEAIVHKTIQPNDEWLLSHADHVHIHDTLYLKQKFHVWDKIKHITVWLNLFDRFHLCDKLKLFVRLWLNEDSMQYYDLIWHILEQLFVEDKYCFRDLCNYYVTLHLDEHLKFEDFIKYIFKEILVSSNYEMFDTVNSMYIRQFVKDKSVIKDAYRLYSILHLEDRFHFGEWLEMIINVSVVENFTLYDVIDSIAKLTLFDKGLKFKDEYDLGVTIHGSDVWRLTDLIYHISKDIFMEEQYSTLYDIADIMALLPVKDKSLQIRDEYKWESKLYCEEAAKFASKISCIFKKSLIQEHGATLFDIMKTISKVQVNETFGLRDTCKITYSE